MGNLLERRQEFEKYVWDHSIDPFQMQFDDRRELSSTELVLSRQLFDAVVDEDGPPPADNLKRIFLDQPEMFKIALQITGLTRNKILQDLRASAALKEQGLTVPSSFDRLPTSPAWAFAGPYLVRRLRSVLSHIDPNKLTLEQVFEALNQATWPGYIRQERAKRSGHEAEARLASLLFSLNIPFEPTEKADNPMCRDAQIDNISFDLVVPDTINPIVVVKSTVHTANIGQYGESKDHLEMVEARRWIDDKYVNKPKPTLLAFIDGVGFRSNSDGLDGVLTKSDEFCQFRTIWKAAVVASKAGRESLQIALERSDREHFADFITRWGFADAIIPRENLDNSIGWIEAGGALIRHLE